MNIKKNDTVLIIAGKDKGKTGKVVSVSPKANRVSVEGINIQKKHKKPRSASDVGGIVDQIGAIDASNAMVICDKCNKATRVAHAIEDGKKIRVCKKCGAKLDKAIVKEDATAKKKATKKATDETAPKKEPKKRASKKTANADKAE